jgi:hypothetical protein
VVRTIRREGAQTMIREPLEPIRSGEGPVDPLQSRVFTFTRPCEQPSLQEQFTQKHLVEELREATHHATVKTTIAFILSFL